MRLRQKDVEVASWCAEMDFKLAWKEGYETIEGLELFTYLGRPLYQSDDDYPVVRKNIGKARQVGGRIGSILRWEGEDHLTSVTFYRVVMQTVILFRA